MRPVTTKQGNHGIACLPRTFTAQFTTDQTNPLLFRQLIPERTEINKAIRVRKTVHHDMLRVVRKTNQQRRRNGKQVCHERYNPDVLPDHQFRFQHFTIGINPDGCNTRHAGKYIGGQ